MRWEYTALGAAKLIKTEHGGAPSVVAEVWYEDSEGMFFADVHHGFNPNEELAQLDELVADADTIDEAMEAVEKWLLRTWGLSVEKAPVEVQE